MSITSPFPWCIAMALVSPVLFQYARAELDDRDRAMLAYNAATDPCISLNAFSVQKERDFADWTCKEAFLALDRIGGNSCSGWRQPGCRFSHDTFQRECSCLISECDQMLVISDVEKPFRECALGLWIDELYVEQGTLPPTDFQETSEMVESGPLEAWPSFNSVTPGTSGGASASYGEGTPLAHSPDPEQGSSSDRDVVASDTSSTMNPEVVEAGNSGPAFFCETCKKPYASAESYDQHMRAHTTDSATCKPCKRIFSTPSNYQAHVRLKHAPGGGEQPGNAGRPAGRDKEKPNEGDTRGAGGKIFRCPEPGCGRDYRSARALRDHKKRHTELLDCRLCGQPFQSRSNFNKHVRRRHKGQEAEASGASAANPEAVEADKTARPFVCEKCGCRFATKHSLRQHMECHKPNSTTCTICNIRCPTIAGYKFHMKIQHKQKPKSKPGEAIGLKV